MSTRAVVAALIHSKFVARTKAAKTAGEVPHFTTPSQKTSSTDSVASSAEGKRIENGTYSSSPLLADGKIYSTNEEGTTTVIKAGPTFEVLGTSRLDSHTLASPVAVDDQIFIRTDEYLYCLKKK